MKKESTFEKRVVSQNSQEQENLILGFKNEAKAISDYWLSLNALLGSLYKLSDIIAFIEQPNMLKEVFNKENKSLAIDAAKENGISVEALKGLDNIALNSKQQGVINELEKFAKFSMFNNGLSSADWLVKEEILVTDVVKDKFQELTTEFTKAPIAISRLNVLEEFEKHIELFPEDKLATIQVIRHGRKFVNHGL